MEASGHRSIKLALLRSQIDWALGEYDRAAAYASLALREDENHAEARYRYIVALAAQKAKRKDALALGQAFLREQPRSPVAMAALGTVYYHAEAFEEAVKFFRPVVNHPSMPAEPQFYFGKSLANHGNLNEAKAVARLVQARAAQPGVFLNRAAAQSWTEEILKSE